jgi:large subunit ribosomal protein L22
MGRAFRYVRRIAHIELVLAEKVRAGEAAATVVGEETSAKAKAPAKTKKKAAAGKKKLAAK